MKKVKFLLLLFFLSVLLYSQLPAQTTQSVLDRANELVLNGRLEEAQIYLERFHRANPKEIKITIACAQVAYQNKKYDVFMDLYTEAIEMQPKNFPMKLEYAKMLFAVNEYEIALPLFEEYLTYEPTNIEALLDKGKILKANEDFIESYNAISKLLTKDPTHAEARELKAELLVLKSKWAKLSVTYANNSQQLDIFSPVLEGGIYFSPLSSPRISLSPILFQRTKGDNINIYKMQFDNRSYLKDFGVAADYGAGLIMYPGTEFDVTARVRFDKYAERYILMTLGAERKPYFGSVFSIDTNVMTHTATGSLTLITKESWNGKSTLESVFFDGVENPVTTLSAYLYAPRLKLKNFDFKIGYAINFASSKLDKFVSDKTPAEIINSGSSAPFFGGDYYPYYTPKNLFSQSVLMAAGYSPTQETQASISVGYGLSGSAEKPYYFRETNILGDVYVSKGYQKENFIPVDVNFSVRSLITPKISMNIDFVYSKNFFYITRALSLGVKVNFWR